MSQKSATGRAVGTAAAVAAGALGGIAVYQLAQSTDTLATVSQVLPGAASSDTSDFHGSRSDRDARGRHGAAPISAGNGTPVAGTHGS